jgi:hypothetical protein
MISVFNPCVGETIEVERENVMIVRGFLLELEAHYKCPACGEDHVATIPEDEWEDYLVDNTQAD